MQRGHMALLVVEEELVTYIFFFWRNITTCPILSVNKPQPRTKTKFTAYFVMKATSEKQPNSFLHILPVAISCHNSRFGEVMIEMYG